MKTAGLLFAVCCLSGQSSAQSDSLKSFQVSGYAEVYYCYDFSEPVNHTRPDFVYSYNRHNEINLNLGFIKASYKSQRTRANMAIMAGTYANSNLANEPGALRHIYEANAGVRLSQSHNLWIDAGVFTSHIGFESTVGADCWNLTRSILADNSPYYECGAKLTLVSKNEKWLVSALYLNGWQHIQRPDGNNTPAAGHQLTWSPNSKFTVNSSSFVGSDTPDSIRMMRYFHNLYAKFQLRKNFGLLIGLDVGAQQKYKGSRSYHSWFAPILVAKYTFTPHWTVAARAEYYEDVNRVIISSAVAPFAVFGASLNLDYEIADNVFWRIEGRWLTAREKIFLYQQLAASNNYFLATSLAVSLN